MRVIAVCLLLAGCVTPSEEWKEHCRKECAPEEVRRIDGVFGPVCRCTGEPKTRFKITIGL